MGTTGHSDVPRPEHPEPQWQRDNWRCLNGTWDFQLDLNCSGQDRGWYRKHDFDQSIVVPFCPESKLSGIEYKDFIHCCWYRRSIELSEKELAGIVRLHFGAVDYETTVYLNGERLGVHRGGYSPFSFDIQRIAHVGVNELVVCVKDELRSGRQPRGKQSERYDSYGCCYTRTTGIWQTVWLEFMPQTHVVSARFHPNLSRDSVGIDLTVNGRTRQRSQLANIAISFEGNQVGSASIAMGSDRCSLEVPLEKTVPWTVGQGNLYDVRISYGEDVVCSYFGMRSVNIDGSRVLINGEPVFQRLVLDQGYYPEGIYTAKDLEELSRDIDLSMAAGFNGARLHQKAFEPRFLYECDRKGYIVWGEMANWGLDITTASGLTAFLPEWLELLERDINHPSIVGWCPFNETWDVDGTKQDDDVLRQTYAVTKAIDPSRPCIDTSGMFHTVTDIYDVHDYEQDPIRFAGNYAGLDPSDGSGYVDPFPERQRYQGCKPFFVSEYGGIKIASRARVDGGESWGYGEAAAGESEFVERYHGLTKALLDNPAIFGFCYTQLYDVEQECNGLYTYDRKPKVDIAAVRDINMERAAIEKS